MEQTIEVRTVYIASTALIAACTGVIGILWRQSRRKHPELAFWFLSYALALVAFVLVAMRGSAPDWASIVLAQTLFVGNQIALLEGLSRFTGIKMRQAHNFVLLGATVVVLSYFALVSPNYAIRAMFLGAVSAVIMGQSAWLTLGRISPEMRQATRPTGLMIAVIAAFGAISSVVTFRNTYGSQANFWEEPLGGAQFLAIETLQAMLMFALFLFLSRRLLDDAERELADRRSATDALAASQHRLEGVLKSVTEVMGKIVERRDPYTQGHEVGVAHLSCQIAEEMGLPAHDIEAIEVAALVHDVGKLAIPAEILTKPGRLTDVEYQLIRGHSQAGYEILKDIDFEWPIADIVLQHHERMDGSGYPHGLKGDEILTAARIIMVADVIDAMGAHRPYRAALGVDAAMKVLDEQPEGFDPAVVAACHRLHRAGKLKLADAFAS